MVVRFTGNGKTEGIVSRDANGTAKPGHFTMLKTCDGRILVRLQDTAKGYFRCSAPVSAAAWHCVGVNFGKGGLRLFVDGKEGTHVGPVKCPERTYTCGTTTTKGIAGNTNPWVLGVAAKKSVEGGALPQQYPFNGAVDNFRISKVNRTY